MRLDAASTGQGDSQITPPWTTTEVHKFPYPISVNVQYYIYILYIIYIDHIYIIYIILYIYYIYIPIPIYSTSSMIYDPSYPVLALDRKTRSNKLLQSAGMSDLF